MQLLKALGITLLYIITMALIGIKYGMDTVESLKYPVCAVFLLAIFIWPFLKNAVVVKENHSAEDLKLLEELKQLKENAKDTVPENPDDLIAWLNGTDGKEAIKIELAPQDKVSTEDDGIRLMLSYMMEPGEEDIAETALLTDLSTVFDFFWTDDEQKQAIDRLNAKLGKDVGVSGEDCLWEALEKIRKEFPNWPNKPKLVLIKS